MRKGWRRSFIWAAGVGAGVTIALLLCLAGYNAYIAQQRDYWGKHSITASYDELKLNTDSESLRADITYKIQNHTTDDYILPSDLNYLFLVSPNDGGLYHFVGGKDDYAAEIRIDENTIIPTRKAVLVTIHLKYEYNDALRAEDRDNVAKLAPYMSTRLSKFDGFALFDHLHRYEIDFPSGWKSIVNGQKSK